MRTAVWLLIDLALIVVFLWIATACRACDVAGVFYFCNDEGPHEIVDAPSGARARAAEVQRELYQYTQLHSPSDTLRFIWRDTSALIFVRVLGHGIPGAAARTDGDSILFNAGNELNTGIMRHEFVHWVQPGNGWLQPPDKNGRSQIHYPPVFSFVHAPLIAG